MTTLDQDTKEILVEFTGESKQLITTLMDLLESIEGDYSQYNRLEEYGQVVDRIMGGVKSVAMSFAESHFIHDFSRYAELCKLISYKASQVSNNQNLFDVTVAFLLDATEMLDTMNSELSEQQEQTAKEYLSKAFLDRLKWLANQFDASLRASVAINEPTVQDDTNAMQKQIDDLLKQLGVG